jgi:hypothetical protein
MDAFGPDAQATAAPSGYDLGRRHGALDPGVETARRIIIARRA